ncbi:hypothetical protein P4T48_18060 [Bacillus paramycoides]|uniref:hypothetical protein n=1 Tax=Bacillus paramycoides TaxID=2026194 RepID=UPI002E1EF5DD|nr:hypothetical protein [Bacillus paramycoides]
MRDLGTEALIFQWGNIFQRGNYKSSLKEIRDKFVELNIAEEQVVLKKNQEEMEDLFFQLAQFGDLSREGISEGQVGSAEVSKCLKTSIATELKVFMLNNVQPSLEELRDKFISLNIARPHVVMKKSRGAMENLLCHLYSFSDYTQIVKSNVSEEEKKRVQKLMERVKKKGPIKAKGFKRIDFD